MSGFNVMALDESFNISSALRPTNLQWNRKYHEPGSFSLQIPVSSYKKDFKYIYTKSRPETGIIKQVNYVVGNGYKYVQLSGYFMEEELNRMVAYPKGSTNITNQPSWTYQDGPAETVATNYFNAFKSLRATMTTGRSINVDLGIVAATSQGRGYRSIHYRNGEFLGAKCYWILKPSGMSYRVNYDFVTSQRKFECWKGRDLYQGNADRNNPVVFSTRHGNIVNPNIIIDEIGYKNAGIAINEQTDNDVTTYTTQAVWDGSDNELNFDYVVVTENPKDYTTAQYKAVLEDEALNKIADSPIVVNVDFDTNTGSYEYMKDFDLGDVCDVVINELEMDDRRRLIGCYEVIKKGKWTLELEFGDPL